MQDPLLHGPLFHTGIGHSINKIADGHQRQDPVNVVQNEDVKMSSICVT